MAIACETYNEMDMRWSIWVSIKQLEQFSGWSIEWNWIWCWLQAIPGVLTVLVRHELASKVVVTLVIVLLFVHAIGRRLPDINCRIWYWFLCLRIGHCSMHIYVLCAGWVMEFNACSLLSYWMVLSEEGSEDCALCCDIGCFGGLLICDFVDQPAETC